jgi:5-formyltetrahydrofolate cyclo-ligase
MGNMDGELGTNPDDPLATQLGETMTVTLRKKALREELRRRMEGKPEDSASVIEKIASYLREHPELKVVSMFAPLPGEVDLRTLPGEIRRTWVFPKVFGSSLVFHVVEDMQRDLAPGAYGILEPSDTLKTVEAGEIDLFLCPGLGFDLQGGRIGRGKGFYDRILGKARPDAVKLGACFSHQVVTEIPMEDHDIRMDGVIAG